LIYSFSFVELIGFQANKKVQAYYKPVLLIYKTSGFAIFY